jgi:hypothetical protein
MDPDVWMRAAAKDNGLEYYEYILVYMEDLLVVSHLPGPIMETIQKAYQLKDEPSPPTNYLGAIVHEWSIPNETRKVWSMNSMQYIKEAIRCIEHELQKTGECLLGKPPTPIQQNSRPELDKSPILGTEQANYYASLNWVLLWAVKLGRIEIHIYVLLLSSHLAQPRIGHLEQVFHIFTYLKHHENSNLVFDPICQLGDCRFHTT